MSELETDYTRKWARTIVEKEGLPALSHLSNSQLDAKVRELLGPLSPTKHEITAIVLGIRDEIRRNAPPADSPRPRGAERMYR